MKSPFPGMDPYMERRWGSVHTRLITYAADAINARVGGTGLRAEIQQRLVVETPVERDRSIYPDVYVADDDEAEESEAAVGPSVSTLAVAEPLVIVADDEPATQNYVEIAEPEGGRVVAVVEFLSPSNKRPGGGREQYLRKQRETLDARINLVEIDLVRPGRRELAYPQANLPPSHQTPYLALVTRHAPRRQHEVYRLPLREPLATIRLPLRPGDADVPLDLQSLVGQAHDACYFRPSDYAGPLRPPLRAADAAWAAGRLAAAGLNAETEQEPPR